MYEHVKIHLLKLPPPPPPRVQLLLDDEGCWKAPVIAERITERRISNRKVNAALPCPCMYREACWVQLGQLTSSKLEPSFGQWLHTGKETTAPHDRTKTQSTNQLLTD